MGGLFSFLCLPHSCFLSGECRSKVVGLKLEGRVDWKKVAALLTESYRALAPKKLAELITSDR